MRPLAGLLVLLAGCLGAARADTQSRGVADFDAVQLELPAEVTLTQGAQALLTLDAEPTALEKITTEVRDRRLWIGVARGHLETRRPIRITLVLRQLRAFESRASATVRSSALVADSLSLRLLGGGSFRLDGLQAEMLDVQLAGANEVAVGAGRVASQRIAMAGSGRYVAPRLDSDRAEVRIDGNGQARLAAALRLDVQIRGVGEVRYRGSPTLTRSVQGVGAIEAD